MVQRALQKLSTQAAHLANDARGYAGWALPLSIGGAWFVWPSLTPAFKEEAFGIATPPAPGSAAATAATGSPNFNPTGKFKYVRGEIGERPTLEEE